MLGERVVEQFGELAQKMPRGGNRKKKKNSKRNDFAERRKEEWRDERQEGAPVTHFEKLSRGRVLDR